MAQKTEDFFISYTSADREWAEWIAWHLEEAGYTTILQAWDFAPGRNFVVAMDEASKRSKCTVLVLSPDYFPSGFTTAEWTVAFRQDPTGEKGRLLPVRVRQCDVEGMLGPVVYINLVGLDEKGASDELLARVLQHRGERAKPKGAPRFPALVTTSLQKPPPFPALPAIWNVPHPRNPNFTGREELLTDLHEKLNSRTPAALTQAIHGLGGVGKTQLALEHAYRRRDDYEVVWWVRSEQPATLGADYAALATELSLPQKDEREQAVIVAAVRRWLEHNGGWLLVFDNALDRDAVREYLPRGETGRVIITSRNPHWSGLAQPLTVKVLPPDEAVAFLLKRTAQTDRQAAEELAEELGYLPLALAQAGAYIAENDRSLAGYLVLFRERQQELLERGDLPTGYEATVAATWNLSFEAVAEVSPVSIDLLNLCAFLAPDDIPLSLISEGAEYLPEPLAVAVKDPLRFDELRAPLRRYSLVECTGEAMSVHRLVQAVIRDRLTEEEGKAWCGVAARVVDEGLPGSADDVRTWPVHARLLPHGLTAAAHAERLEVAPEATGRLLNEAGVYLSGRAEYAEAKGLYQQALVVSQSAYGAEHTRVAACLSNLGTLLQEMGHLPAAREHCERALAITEKAYGPDHPNVAIQLDNLGGVLRDMGNLHAAWQCLERALGINEKVYGPNHAAVARDLNNLASVLYEAGDLPRAREYFERVVRICERAYPRNHPNLATALNNLGALLQDLGEFDGAHEHHQRALAIDQKAYGAEHPAVARDATNLGTVLRAKGDLQGARQHYQRALAIWRKCLGDDHRNTKLVRRKLEELGGEA